MVARPDEGYRTPDEITALVCDAIRAERFYVLTHPDHTREQVRARAEAIEADEAPPLFRG